VLRCRRCSSSRPRLLTPQPLPGAPRGQTPARRRKDAGGARRDTDSEEAGDADS
jgi:hypothetical protein